MNEITFLFFCVFIPLFAVYMNTSLSGLIFLLNTFPFPFFFFFNFGFLKEINTAFHITHHVCDHLLETSQSDTV